MNRDTSKHVMCDLAIDIDRIKNGVKFLKENGDLDGSEIGYLSLIEHDLGSLATTMRDLENNSREYTRFWKEV